jgi:uncharacterized protein involved in oxidation of intracellular sulfur
MRRSDPGRAVTVFPIADAVGVARRGQKVPEGYCSRERMLKRVVAGKGSILLCGTCMDARGMTNDDIMDGARRSTMDELAVATAEAVMVLVFRRRPVARSTGALIPMPVGQNRRAESRLLSIVTGGQAGGGGYS